MTTIPNENVEIVTEKKKAPPEAPLPENATVTTRPAFPDAKLIISRAFAQHVEQDMLKRGYVEMSVEMSEWSETTLVAQAETLPTE